METEMKKELFKAINTGCEMVHLKDAKWNIVTNEIDLVTVTLFIGDYTIYGNVYNVSDVIAYSIYTYAEDKEKNMGMKKSGRLPQFKTRYFDSGENDFFLYDDDLNSEGLSKAIATVVRYIFNTEIMGCESGFYIGNEEMTKAFVNHPKFKCCYSRSTGCMIFKDADSNEAFWKTTKVIEYERYTNLFWFFKTKNTKYMLTAVKE